MSWLKPRPLPEIEPERPPEPRNVLSDDVKAHYREMVTIINPEWVPGLQAPGIDISPTIKRSRFDQQACIYCRGVHSSYCRAVKSYELYESGHLKSIRFRRRWDDSGVIWREDVFGDSPEDGGV